MPVRVPTGETVRVPPRFLTLRSPAQDAYRTRGALSEVRLPPAVLAVSQWAVKRRYFARLKGSGAASANASAPRLPPPARHAAPPHAHAQQAERRGGDAAAAPTSRATTLRQQQAAAAAAGERGGGGGGGEGPSLRQQRSARRRSPTGVWGGAVEECGGRGDVEMAPAEACAEPPLVIPVC